MSRATERHLLNFDLAGQETQAPLTFHVAMREYALQRHSPPTLSDARADNGFLRLVPDRAVSHYAEVPLPADGVALMWVTTPITVDGLVTERIVSMGIHVPREARLRDVRRKLLLADEGLHPKLKYRNQGQNLLRGDLLAIEAAPDKITDYQDAYETAVSLLFKHPELINLDKDAQTGGPVTIIEACIRRALNKYSLLTEAIFKHANDWSGMERVLDDGKPAFDKDGDPLFAATLHDAVKLALVNPLSYALVLANQAEELRGQNWSLQYGNTKAGYAGNVKPKPKTLAEPLRGAGDVRWRLKNLTPSDGLVFEPDVRFVPGAAGTNWRAEGAWSSTDEKSTGPFDEAAQKALADGSLHLVFDDLSGAVVPVAGKSKVFAVKLASASSSKSAKGECTLSADGSVLQYFISSSNGPFTTAYFAIGAPASLRKIHSIAVRDAGSNGNVTVVAKNHWLRHLSCYVEFLDAAGKAMVPPNWSSRFPVAGAIFDTDPHKRFVDVVGPVETMMGIPLPADSTHMNVPVPASASTIRFTWGGLGTGRNDTVACPTGAIMTVVVEMALPTMLLVAGAALTASGGMMKIIRQKPVIGALLIGFTEIYIGFADNPAKAAWTVGKKLIPVIAKAGLGQLSQWIAEKIAVGAAKKAIPFINVALFIADAAATAAQLAQTTSAVRQSPRAHVTEITRSIDLSITITSSKLYKKFPDHHHHLSIVVAYDSGATLPALSQNLPPETISDDIIVKFQDVPAAGNLRVLVFFYAENGWQSGQGASAWMKAEGSGGSATLVVPAIEIEINEIPLGAWSIYEHQEKIVMRNGEHVWQAGPPPTATKSTPSPIHGSILKLHSITMAQYPQMIGYAWQATDLNVPPDDVRNPRSNEKLFAVQNLSVLQHPQKGYGASAVGFRNTSGVGYDIVSPDDGSGRNFFIDSTRGVYDETNNPDGGFHLRHVSLDFKRGPAYDGGANNSWGRFPDSIDQMVVHPHGYVFAIGRGVHKLYRIALPERALSDALAPMATLISGEGSRHGLMKSPLAVALAIDGRVLVLESGNARVQCFDIHGNPVPYFLDPANGKLSPVMALRPGKLSLLDMAVEAKGYIFILGYIGTGAKPADYRMDLYDPAGTFLVSTSNFTAARITVDLLRNLFALNYEVLQGKDNRTEPGISHWRAPAPPKQQA